MSLKQYHWEQYAWDKQVEEMLPLWLWSIQQLVLVILSLSAVNILLFMLL